MVKCNRLIITGLICLIPMFWYLSRVKPNQSINISSQERWLSYIPPLDIYSVQEPMLAVSLKKLNVFTDEPLDNLAFAQELKPVIDKVIFIPEHFHAHDIG